MANLESLALLAVREEDFAAARQPLGEALEFAQAEADDTHIAQVLRLQGIVELLDGYFELGVRLHAAAEAQSAAWKAPSTKRSSLWSQLSRELSLARRRKQQSRDC